MQVPIKNSSLMIEAGAGGIERSDFDYFHDICIPCIAWTSKFDAHSSGYDFALCKFFL